VALRLQRAAEARRSRMTASLVSAERLRCGLVSNYPDRSRMTASLVSVASHTITRIGLGMTGGGNPGSASPSAAGASTTLPDRADEAGGGGGGRSTAVAELHSSNAGDDQPTPPSPGARPRSLPSAPRLDNDERPTTGDDTETPDDCDCTSPIASRRPDVVTTDRNKPPPPPPPAEETPILLYQCSRRRAPRSAHIPRTTLPNSVTFFAPVIAVAGSTTRRRTTAIARLRGRIASVGQAAAAGRRDTVARPLRCVRKRRRRAG